MKKKGGRTQKNLAAILAQYPHLAGQLPAHLVPKEEPATEPPAPPPVEEPVADEVPVIDEPQVQEPELEEPPVPAPRIRQKAYTWEEWRYLQRPIEARAITAWQRYKREHASVWYANTNGK